jgi:hypothetical protein
MAGGGVGLMGRPKKGVRTVPARLTEEAARWAKIASAYSGESLVDYVSRIVIERSRRDVESYHAEVTKKGKPPGSK